MQNHPRPTVRADPASDPARAFLEGGDRPAPPPQPAPRPKPSPPPRTAQAPQTPPATGEPTYEQLLNALPALPPSRWGRALHHLTGGRLRPGA
ncbi:hypothetical protein HNR23_003919 [Nocardiopsis mwathae]|uniref:Uncharacterized protein n=1 Tax=Nocardiopsis mwathae TaxID=1472723 RepID=A0A7W9YKI0_9ACTN|nr:hypothetical protein [Nocardiopsis mwathae]MBB6173859.1 hypothetical protein [Nocardiopsis mwathae]